MYAFTLPRSNWLRRASIRLAWYRHMPASSSFLFSSSDTRLKLQINQLLSVFRTHPVPSLFISFKETITLHYTKATSVSDISRHLFVCLSVAKMCTQKKALFSKISNLELGCLLTTNRSPIWAFQRTHYWTHLIRPTLVGIVIVCDGDMSDIVRCSKVNRPPRVKMSMSTRRWTGANETINSSTCFTVVIRTDLNGRFVQCQVDISVIQWYYSMHSQPLPYNKPMSNPLE